MASHRILGDLFRSFESVGPGIGRDPGNGGTITPTNWGQQFLIKTAGAETRTLARPAMAGILTSVVLEADGGDLTLTVTGGYNTDGDTSIVFSDAGDMVVFMSVKTGTTYQWTAVAQEGDLYGNSHLFDSVGGSIEFLPAINYIDPSATSCVISGGGKTAASTRVIETGTSFRNEIGAHASYVAGTASLATIAGGYDHRNDQLAGTISGGGHNLLNYQGNHGTIAGGSFNSVVGASNYIFIGGGTANTVGQDGNASNSVVSGGFTNLIRTGQSNVISGGNTNTIQGGASSSVVAGGVNNNLNASAGNNVISGGSANAITGSSTGAAIAGGLTCSIATGNGSFVGAGRENVITSAGYSAVFGDRCVVASTAANSLTFGQRSSAVVYGSLNGTGRDFGSVVGSCQFITFVTGIQTTDATATNMASTSTSTYPVPPSNSAWNGRVYLTGRERGTTNVVMYAWDFGFAKASGNLVIKFGATASTALIDDIGVAGLPVIAAGTSTFRLTVQGKAATSIDWVARFDVAQTLQ